MEEFTPTAAAVVESVERCGLFGAVDGSARAELLDAFGGMRLETGDVLVHEGDPGDALYLVRHGRLRAHVAGPDGTQLVVGEIGRHEVVGEMALLADEPRSATVVALRDTEVLVLPAAMFDALSARFPGLIRQVAGVVVERLRDSPQRARPSAPRGIAVVPAPGVDARTLAVDVVATMQAAGHAAVAVTADDATAWDDPSARLLEIEAATDVCLLVADDTATDWTRRCVRHADRVLVVVEAWRPVTPTVIATDDVCVRRCDGLSVELVAVHRGSPNASAWLARQRFDDHHVVRERSRTDLARLGRRLAGNSTVVVLGGGGARGFAHFGVLGALDEAGVPVDAVVGTSAGALVGGCYARHGAVDPWQDLVVEWFERVRWRRDMNPPVLALLSGRLMSEGFHELYGDDDIRDLPLPFAAVSTDLTSARAHVHADGPLWQAVRASASVPGLFPPVAVGGRVLVDGGLVDNLPVGVALARHPGARVIAVDVGQPGALEPGALDGTGVAPGWAALRRRADGMPTLPRVLMRLTELGRDDRVDGAQVVIRPDVARWGLTDTSDARAVIAAGRRAAEEAVAAGLGDV